MEMQELSLLTLSYQLLPKQRSWRPMSTWREGLEIHSLLLLLQGRPGLTGRSSGSSQRFSTRSFPMTSSTLSNNSFENKFKMDPINDRLMRRLFNDEVLEEMVCHCEVVAEIDSVSLLRASCFRVTLPTLMVSVGMGLEETSLPTGKLTSGRERVFRQFKISISQRSGAAALKTSNPVN
jgi:hypothetical protein